MKKRTIVGIGAGLVASAIAATGCHINEIETVYGPPQEYATGDPADEIEDVYGPPVDYEEEGDTGEEAFEESEEESISDVETVYGPPPDYEETDAEREWR